jgi:hypothetical protein
MLRLLFLTDDREDYLADGLLHGLRQLPDVELVDWPRKDCLYTGGRVCARAPEYGVRGGGFSLYGLLDEPKAGINRNQIWRRLEGGWFNAVIIGNVWRQWGLLVQWRELLARQPLLLLDGDDDQRLYPCSGTRFRQFGVGSGATRLLQQSSTYYFKREFTSRTRRWGLRLQLHQIGFSIPEQVILDCLPKKTKLFPSHIVDHELCERIGASSSYAFADEAAYRNDLACSRFGITTRRAGWDCLRHYEIAASGTIPCFRDLQLKPPLCAPHGLKDGVNCISYRNADQLMQRIENLSAHTTRILQHNALAWAKANCTRERANYLLKLARIAKGC